jgi:hypothetical protein
MVARGSAGERQAVTDAKSLRCLPPQDVLGQWGRLSRRPNGQWDMDVPLHLVEGRGTFVFRHWLTVLVAGALWSGWPVFAKKQEQ